MNKCEGKQWLRCDENWIIKLYISDNIIKMLNFKHKLAHFNIFYIAKYYITIAVFEWVSYGRKFFGRCSFGQNLFGRKSFTKSI